MNLNFFFFLSFIIPITLTLKMTQKIYIAYSYAVLCIMSEIWTSTECKQEKAILCMPTFNSKPVNIHFIFLLIFTP